jgi:hypothetical protein
VWGGFSPSLRAYRCLNRFPVKSPGTILINFSKSRAQHLQMPDRRLKAPRGRAARHLRGGVTSRCAMYYSVIHLLGNSGAQKCRSPTLALFRVFC